MSGSVEAWNEEYRFSIAFFCVICLFTKKRRHYYIYSITSEFSCEILPFDICNFSKLKKVIVGLYFYGYSIKFCIITMYASFL